MDHSIRITSNFAIFCVSYSFTKLCDVTCPEALIRSRAEPKTNCTSFSCLVL